MIEIIWLIFTIMFFVLAMVHFKRTYKEIRKFNIEPYKNQGMRIKVGGVDVVQFYNDFNERQFSVVSIRKMDDIIYIETYSSREDADEKIIFSINKNDKKIINISSDVIGKNNLVTKIETKINYSVAPIVLP